MRVLISIIATMLFFGSAIGSESADYFLDDAEALFARIPEQSCYNYTFIDDSAVRVALLERESMKASLDTPDSLLYDGTQNLCRGSNMVFKAGLNKAGSAAPQDEESEQSSSNRSILPNPEIGFVEEGALNYSDYEIFRARDTIFYGGVVPFIAIPDDDLANEDTFFNEDSISLFLYFKRKF